MKEADAGRSQLLFVVAALFSKVDDRPDAMTPGKVRRLLPRKAAADRQTLGKPVPIRHPRSLEGRHGSFLLLFLTVIFFFMNNHGTLLLFVDFYCCFYFTLGNNKAS